MKITIIGTGYVGLVTGVSLADVGHNVWCVDVDKSKLEQLSSGKSVIFEPGLQTLLERGLQHGRLHFTDKLAEALQNSSICFLTVGTPPNKKGEVDLTHLWKATRAIGETMTSPLLVVTKSTIPVGTTLEVEKIIHKILKRRGKKLSLLSVANNPEFLKEGSAIADFQRPDRIVIGVKSKKESQLLRDLYSPFMRKQDCFLEFDIPSSEMAKYGSNAMLATRISFINELANLCEQLGADIYKVKTAMGWDPRIGTHYLYPGLGYGGSCLPKDILALLSLGKQKREGLPLLRAVHKTNEEQKLRFWKKMEKHFGGSKGLRGKRIAIWGLAFKPETDDIREAPSLYLIQQLLRKKAILTVYDPTATEAVRQKYGSKLLYAANGYAALKNANALVICTEWNQFRSPDFIKMKKIMKAPVIFDGRNLYSPDKIKKAGFTYYSVGR